jgi:tetratricopeptide (TPR) repeat protein
MKPFSCLPFACFTILFIAAPALTAQENVSVRETGEEIIAARYLDWALTAVREGRFSQAEAFLTRAADYASVSSDLSYLFAVVKKELGMPRRDVLTAARLALETDRWSFYSRQDARYLEAELLISMRRYAEALDALSILGENERAAELRLTAMRRLPNNAAFYAAMEDAFKRYPYQPAFPRILFNRELKNAAPDDRQRALIDTALKRLPALLKLDAGLIRFAAPFISDVDEARRLLSAWRVTALSDSGQSGKSAARAALLESLPVSLDIGLLDEETAINELFDHGGLSSGHLESAALDRGILFSVWGLLRSDSARDLMRDNLLSFSGVITGDENGDGVADSRAGYVSGVPVSYSRDADQDGVNELSIMFDGGWPLSAEFAYVDGAESGVDRVSLVWDVYPALREAVFGGARYFFRPMEFNYSAARFETLGGTGGILLPDADAPNGGFSRRAALSYAYLIERAGRDFPGSIERIECNAGVILISREYVDGVLCAETNYENGMPVLQRIDLDLDGRLETTRRFRPAGDAALSSEIEVIETIESDWDGDGFVEYRETQ